MSVGVEFSSGLSGRESATWGGAAALVLAAHLLGAYAWYANTPEAPAAEAMEQALEIDLAPMAAEQEASEALPPEPIPEVEEHDEAPKAPAEENIEPIKPIEEPERAEPEQTTPEPEAVQPPEPEPLAEPTVSEPIQLPGFSPLPPLEKVEIPEPVPEAEPPAVDPPDPDQVVLPDDAPTPTARPEPPTRTAEPVRRKAQTPPQRVKPRQTKPARQKTRAAESSSASASKAPRFDPAKWQTKVVQWLNRHKRYPSAARSRGVEGTAHVSFAIDRSGRVLSARIARSSGNAMLDQAALDMVRRSSPVPAPPQQVARQSITLGVPVNFQIR